MKPAENTVQTSHARIRSHAVCTPVRHKITFKITKLLEEIDELIADNDLQFVEHNVEKSVNNDSIDIKFNIFEGEKILVERINITGNSITNESVIRGELVIDEGDPFTKLGLDYTKYVIQDQEFMRPEELKYLKGDSTKMRKEFGWEPEYSFESLMDEMIEHWEEQIRINNIIDKHSKGSES